MLLLFWSAPQAPFGSIPDEETTYYPVESGIIMGEYVARGEGLRSVYPASEQTPATSYRQRPTRR